MAGLVSGAMPAAAQEVATILSHREWRVAGVCIGVDQCGFCSITNNLHPAAFLDLRPPQEVSVLITNGQGKTPVILEIGQQTFALVWKDNDTFAAEDADSGRIIEAMQHAAALTLRVGGAASVTSYPYSLADFPPVYAALLKATAEK
jgi:hypothetical protein